jgi:CBS domain-containing protein
MIVASRTSTMTRPIIADPRATLAHVPGCAGLGPAALDRVLRASRTEEFPASSVIVVEGMPAPDWYCAIEAGAVQVSRVDLEADEILDFLTAGDVVDAGPPGEPAAWTAIAVEPVRCLLVPRGAVAAVALAPATGVVDAPSGDLALVGARLRDLVKQPPVTCGVSASVSEAAALMSRRGVGSIIVTGDDGSPRGIVTDRDLRSKVLAAGLALTVPIGAVMSSPLIALRADALAVDALLEMTRRNIHHLGIEEAGRLLGVLSSHDLLWLHGAHPVALAREIEGAASLDALAAIAPRVHAVVAWLAAAGAAPFDIGRIVAELNDRLVARTLAIIEARLEASGYGRPPVPYSWLAAGSEGRREQTLRTDQDNGVVYVDPPDGLGDAVTAYFDRLSAEGTAALVRFGFPSCPGGFMASNHRWCQPASKWRTYFDSWMETFHPDSLLAACIYLDLRPIGGETAPGRALWDWVCEWAPTRRLFLGYMARVAVERQPALGLLGGFVVERTGPHKDSLDLKARGTFPMTQAMRVLALSLGVRETNTVERLVRVGEAGVFSPGQVEELRDAYAVISRLRLAHQLERLAAAREPDNWVAPRELGRGDRLLLKEAFRSLAWLQRVLEDRFQTAMIA